MTPFCTINKTPKLKSFGVLLWSLPKAYLCSDRSYLHALRQRSRKNPFSNRCTRPVGPPTHSILLRHSIGRLNFRTKTSRESEKSAPKTSCDKLCGHREARLTAHAWLCTCLFRVVHKIGSKSLVRSTCWDKLNGKTRCVRSWFQPRGNFLTTVNTVFDIYGDCITR